MPARKPGGHEGPPLPRLHAGDAWDAEEFTRTTFPRLKDMPLGDMMRATGLAEIRTS